MQVIPGTAEEITADWLAGVLDAPVAATRLVDAHSGTTGRAVLELDYAEPTRLPRRLFVKLPPTDEMQRAFVVATGMGRQEARFYRQLAAEVPSRVPRCYHADWDDSGEHYIMLLEHLEDSGCTFRNASTHYSLDYLRSMMVEFARLHAAYWDSPRFAQDLSWLQPPVQHEIAVQLIEVALGQHGPAMPPVFTAMAELYLERADAIHRLWNEGVPTVVHGDVHDANLFMDAQRPGLLDWAIVSRAPGMRDVGYFLAGTLENRDRAAWQEDLLDCYRDALLKEGIAAPAAEDLWRQYQWHAAYVWVGATTTLAMGDAWQPVSYVLASLERLHGAMDAIGSVEAIRAAT